MKHLSKILSFLLALALLCAASPSGALAEGGALRVSDDSLRQSAHRDVNSLKGLALSLVQESDARYALSLSARFRNQTKRSFSFGAGFALEVKLNGVWYTLKNSAVPPALGFVLGAQSTMRHAFSVTDDAGRYADYGVIEPGLYRVVWRLYDEATNEAFDVAAEFTVAEDVRRYASEPVNLRSGPGTKHAVMRELAAGEGVFLIKNAGKWALVRTADGTGYVYGKYLAAENPYRYASEPVNLRSGPGAKHAVIRELAAGERVFVLRKSGKWLLVETLNGTGYVFGKYLSENPPWQ
ncbi:MAG TPA: SH3 domain-containing protein [Clostridia bacterium]|nr:SH3 domain-containing protein [Clostridia bacterium]HPK16691.1 SH3 domain-containing protein [Clostridia bacterium]